METEEQCAACCASLSLVYSETTQSFDWAKCKNSHIWRELNCSRPRRIPPFFRDRVAKFWLQSPPSPDTARCSITLAAMSDPTTRACTCCWAKSLVPGGAGQSEAERSMLEAASRCIYCGSCWVVP
ncbi:hypothetical protein BCV70DRAFT_198499 [Testicularia cyperi]|uniref:Transcription factor IIIC putative zinc-finger domain-containing protein n=1 Tax=Testicularia cyperi TaxID=1882483 RepID=A0A317XVB1_9BASI|nr:hypothetical protein BCV70DRAFT_198499 [Testicularia cyperi]